MNIRRTCLCVRCPWTLSETRLVRGRLLCAATPTPAWELVMTVIGMLGRQLMIMCALLAGRKLGLCEVSLHVWWTALNWNVRGARVWNTPVWLGMECMIPWLFRLLASSTALAEVNVIAVVLNLLSVAM